MSEADFGALDKYVRAVVTPYVGDQRIALWDVMNEPSVTVLSLTEEGKAQIWGFVRHYGRRRATPSSGGGRPDQAREGPTEGRGRSGGGREVKGGRDNKRAISSRCDGPADFGALHGSRNS